MMEARNCAYAVHNPKFLNIAVHIDVKENVEILKMIYVDVKEMIDDDFSDEVKEIFMM